MSEGQTLEDLCRRLLKIRELSADYHGAGGPDSRTVTLVWHEGKGWKWGEHYANGRHEPAYANSATDALRLMAAKIPDEERASAFRRREEAEKIDRLVETMELVLR